MHESPVLGNWHCQNLSKVAISASKNSPASLTRVDICHRGRRPRLRFLQRRVSHRLPPNESTRQAMRRNAKHGLWQAFIALVVTSLATLLAPFSAMAESSIVGADQAAAAGEDAAPESLRANNG